jgi:hypothetical protein
MRKVCDLNRKPNAIEFCLSSISVECLLLQGIVIYLYYLSCYRDMIFGECCLA